MMKNIFQSIIKAALLLFVLPIALSSCQSEQEIGTPLYPVDAEDYTAIAYIDNHGYNRKNFKSTTYSQAGTQTKLVIPDDTLRFKVLLTVPAEKDLTFRLKIDNSKVAQNYKDAYKGLTAEALKIEKEAVVIRQGQMQSEEPFSVVLNAQSKELLGLDENTKGMLALTMESADGIKISEKYNSYCWEVDKEVLWIDPNGTVDNLTKIDVNTYDVITGIYGDVGSELSDDDVNTFARYMISERQSDFITINLKEPVGLSAIQLTPSKFFFGERLFLFFTKEIEVLGSLDGENYTRLGYATNPKTPTGPQDIWNVVFFSSQKVKHVKIRTISTFMSDQEGQTIFLSELRLFK